MEAGKRDISIIFNRGRVLRIPHFQRSYVWGEEQWERFLEDMAYAARTDHPYFMGSIILKQQEGTSDQKHAIWTIIDGQQRLTTILLFFRALFNKKGDPDRFSQIFSTYSNDIILEHNYSDRAAFERILLNQEVDARQKKSKIYQCYEYFMKNIDADQINPNHLLSNVSFVGIDLQFQEDEQQIFDTINSLGIRLTTAELLKNYFFDEDVNFYNINWRDVFEKDDDIRQYWEQDVTSGRNIRTNIDLFLQSYLFIKIQEPELNVNSDDKERFFKIDSVFNSYKELIRDYNLNKITIINELKEYAAIYKNTINPKITEQDVDKSDYVQRLNLVMFGLDITTIIPYVLYVAKKVSSEDERNKIFKYLESYLMRRLVCRKTSKNYNQLFRSLINNGINSFESLKTTIEMKSDKINNMPSDNAVKLGFAQSELANRQSKGVLYFIERTIRSDLQATEMKSFSEYSLEHVMPKKWRNNWNEEKLNSEASEQRDTLVRSLGNLTLITKNLNSSIRDSDWDRKRKGSGRNHGLNEYAQGIEIFSRYLARDSWTDNCIKERSEELGNYAINNVWNIDSSNLDQNDADIDTEDGEKYPISEDMELFCYGPFSNAKANIIDQSIVRVHKGSTARLEITPSFENSSPYKLREDLIKRGILAQETDHLAFTQDYDFDSLSSASSIVLGMPSNGKNDWKDKDGTSVSKLIGENSNEAEDNDDESEKITKNYDKDYYIAKGHNEEAIDDFFSVADRIEEIIKKNGWKLDKRLNNSWVAFKFGKRQVFCLSWYSKKKFGIWFKIAPEHLKEFEKVCPYKPADHDKDWGGTGVDYDGSIDISKMEKTFELIYNLFSKK